MLNLTLTLTLTASILFSRVLRKKKKIPLVKLTTTMTKTARNRLLLRQKVLTRLTALNYRLALLTSLFTTVTLVPCLICMVQKYALKVLYGNSSVLFLNILCTQASL